MNLTDLQTLWNSEENYPTAALREAVTKRLIITLERRRRGQKLWLIWTFFLLVLMTGFSAYVLFGTNKVHLANEWGFLPLLLLPWAVALYFLKLFSKPASSPCAGDLAICQALEQSLKANQASQFRLRVVGGLYLIIVPLLAIAMSQLHTVGKASDNELWSIALFMGGAILVSAAVVFAKYRFWLLPEQKCLRYLLKQFESTAGQ